MAGGRLAFVLATVSPLYLHGVVGVLVVEDEGLLAELVVSLQLVDVGFVVDDVLLVLFQAVHLFLQGAGNVHRHVADLLQAYRGRKLSFYICTLS